MFSHLSPNGLYNDECIYIKSTSQINKLVFNIDNKLNWMNSKFKDFDIYKYVNIYPNIYLANKYNGNYILNNNFDILKYIKNKKIKYNYIKKINLKDNNILIYDINNLISAELFNDNYYLRYFLTLKKLKIFFHKINKYSNNKINIICLFNLFIYNKLFNEQIISYLNNLGYIYLYSYDKTIYLFSKSEITN
jgi:hypothetical protein